MSITGVSHLVKWKTLQNCQPTKYCFSPLYVPGASSSSPGPVWSVRRKSRWCRAPHSCWPAHRRREPVSSCVKPAGTAGCSGAAPSARCWEKTSSCSRRRDRSPGQIYCPLNGGWWCSRRQTWKYNSRVLKMSRSYWGGKADCLVVTCSSGVAQIQDIETCRWPWWPSWCRGPHTPPYWPHTHKTNINIPLKTLLTSNFYLFMVVGAPAMDQSPASQ